MNCPVCNESLEKIIYEGQELHRCISCSGLLVSAGAFEELQHKNDRHLATLMSSPEKEVSRKGGVRHCPSCGKKMKTADFAWDADIEIDICDACELIWLDGGELNLIHEHLKEHHPDLIENELEYESKKFFHWVRFLLGELGRRSPQI